MVQLKDNAFRNGQMHSPKIYECRSLQYCFVLYKCIKNINSRCLFTRIKRDLLLDYDNLDNYWELFSGPDFIVELIYALGLSYYDCIEEFTSSFGR